MEEENEVIEPGSEANPGEDTEVNTEAAAAASVPGANGEGASGAVAPVAGQENQINDLGGKQPSTTDPFAAFKQAIGELQVQGKPVEIRDLEHAKRLMLSGVGADKTAQHYQAVSEPYKWLNGQLADEGNQALFKTFRQDPGYMKTIAGWSQDPAMRKMLDHMRFNPDYAKTLAGWTEQYESKGELDASKVALGRKDLETASLRDQVTQFTETQKQAEAERQKQAEVKDLWGKVNEYNNGIPFTQKQLAQIEIFRDGMRQKPGFENYTASQALVELKEAGLWVTAKKDPGPGAPGGAPPAQRQKPGYQEKTPEQKKAELMANW
jgi:hypothetical protein